MAGVGCLVAGVAVGGAGSLKPWLLPVGGGLLLVAVAWSAISAFQVNVGVLAVTFAGAAQRRTQLTEFCTSQRRDLELCATEICGDPIRAADAVHAAVAAAAASWAGPLDDSLRAYLLCVVVRQARHQERLSGPVPPGPPVPATTAWATLGVRDRAILLLTEREDLPLAAVATMLDTSAEAVRRELVLLHLSMPDVAGAP